MNCCKMYENVMKDLGKVKGGNDEKFSELFLLTCMLIDNMSCGNKEQLDRILTLLKEFDYEKNFRGGN